MTSTARAIISSPHNALFRRWLAAKDKPDRRTGEIVLEGFHLIEDWSRRHGVPEGLVVSAGHKMAGELLEWLRAHPVPVDTLAPSLFARLSSLDHFTGPMALVRTAARPAGHPEAARGDLVFLDRVQDPGNLGTIMRSCVALGVRQLALAPGTVWPWSPKVLRAGMSAHFELEVFEDFSADRLAALGGFQVLVTSGNSDPRSLPIHALNLTRPSLWCFGNEGSGLAPEILDMAGAQRVHVPHTGTMESLNVASALAVCLYEQQRQRLTKR